VSGVLTLGVDPGAVSGAYAVLDKSGTLLEVADLPSIASGKLRWIDGPALLSKLIELRAGRPVIAYVERQGARPGQGLSSTFTSAAAFGSLLATLQIAGCSIELVTAAQWKAAMGLTKDKGRSLDAARLRFPDASLDRKKDHGRAEAIMLALYGLTRARSMRAAA
jgi:crossover junction endodeoxyribonuclease RuvC